MLSPATSEFQTRVAAAFGLGAVHAIQPLGGTATPKWTVVTDRGRYVVRVRPVEFSSAEQVRFAHTVLNRLADFGLPVPRALARADGTTTLSLDGRTYEVLSWAEGQPWVDGDPTAVKNLGSFLARFHQITAELIGDDNGLILREDHPDALQECLSRLCSLSVTPEQSRQLAVIGELLQRGRQELESTLYPALPRTVIHGDFHPGNVRFQGPEVAALYDFDYLAVQARVRDVADALMFFASRRTTPFGTDSIHGLTQPFVPDAVACQAALAGYQAVSPLTPDEWQALPLLIRSRWIQMRLRGSRKVPPQEQLNFALAGFGSVIDWIDQEGPGFFTKLRRASR